MKKRLSKIDGGTFVADHIGHGNSLCATGDGDEMTLGRQRAIIDFILDNVVIKPAEYKTSRLDPSRVRPIWLL